MWYCHFSRLVMIVLQQLWLYGFEWGSFLNFFYRALSSTKVILKIRTDGCGGTNREVRFLEHVQAKVSLNAHRRGDVKIYLTSPSGTRSTLLPRRPNDSMGGNFNNWPFLSVHFWGERSEGEWTLEIEDAGSFGSGGGSLSPYSSLPYFGRNYRYNGLSILPVTVLGMLLVFFLQIGLKQNVFQITWFRDQ